MCRALGTYFEGMCFEVFLCSIILTHLGSDLSCVMLIARTVAVLVWRKIAENAFPLVNGLRSNSLSLATQCWSNTGVPSFDCSHDVKSIIDSIVSKCVCVDSQPCMFNNVNVAHDCVNFASNHTNVFIRRAQILHPSGGSSQLECVQARRRKVPLDLHTGCWSCNNRSQHRGI